MGIKTNDVRQEGEDRVDNRLNSSYHETLANAETQQLRVTPRVSNQVTELAARSCGMDMEPALENLLIFQSR